MSNDETETEAHGIRRTEEAGDETEGHKSIRRIQPAGQDDDDTEGHGPGKLR